MKKNRDLMLSAHYIVLTAILSARAFHTGRTAVAILWLTSLILTIIKEIGRSMCNHKT